MTKARKLALALCIGVGFFVGMGLLAQVHPALPIVVMLVGYGALVAYTVLRKWGHL